MECFVPAPVASVDAVGVPCCDQTPHLPADATFGDVAFDACVGGGARFSHDILVAIAADG